MAADEVLKSRGHGEVGPSFPFFVGRGRSGSTLVRAIFDSHSALAIPNESYFVAYMGKHRKRYEQKGDFLLERYLNDLFRRPGFLSWNLDLGAVAKHVREANPQCLADAIRATYQFYAATKGKTRYADKTPIYVMNIHVLARLFPEAQFIHVLRDGRDSALSYREVPWGPTSIDESAFLWRRSVMKARRAARRLPPSRYIELRYETLIEDPEGVVREMCQFLNLSFEADMLRYYVRAGEITEHMRNPDARDGLYKPITKGLRDWRTQMTTDEVDRFESIAGRALSEFGYVKSQRPIRFQTSAMAWGRVARMLVRQNSIRSWKLIHRVVHPIQSERRWDLPQ